MWLVPRAPIGRIGRRQQEIRLGRLGTFVKSLSCNSKDLSFILRAREVRNCFTHMNSG